MRCFVQIGVNIFPCGAQNRSEKKGQKGNKLGGTLGHYVTINVNYRQPPNCRLGLPARWGRAEGPGPG